MEIRTMASLFSPRRRSKPPIGRRRRTVRLELQPLEERSLLSGYQQINLVGYQPGMAPHTDPNLNGWGMDFAPGGPFCVADTTPGVATFYDRSGQVLPQVVTIPAAPSQPLGPVGRPTGVVYNPTSDFVISENGKSAPAEFLFDARDGTISGWNPAVDPDHAIIMVDNSTESPSRADYTGLVIAQNSQGQNVLYAADFHNNKIDMFDGGFHSLGSFTDPNVPAQYPGHTAWQVEDLNGQLWVTFASHKPGPYGGVVDIFDTDGNLLTPNHFAANAPGGPLANPWGIVQAPAHFGTFSNDILIGNVEGGDIDAFDPATGAFLGSLQKPDGTPIAIPGLWDLAFGAGSPQRPEQATLLRCGTQCAQSGGQRPLRQDHRRGGPGEWPGRGHGQCGRHGGEEHDCRPGPAATGHRDRPAGHGLRLAHRHRANQRWCVHDVCPPGQEQQDRRGGRARGMSPASNGRAWCSVGAGVDHLTAVAGGKGLIDPELRSEGRRERSHPEGGRDRSRSRAAARWPGRFSSSRSSPSEPDRPVQEREVALAGVWLDAA